MSLGLHVIVCRRVENAGVANIGTVQIAEEVDGSAKGKNGQVLFTQQCLFLSLRILEFRGQLVEVPVSMLGSMRLRHGVMDLLLTSLFLLTSTSSSCFSLSDSISSIE